MKFGLRLGLAIAVLAFGVVAQTREQTTIQTSAMALKGDQAAIVVKYLNLPFRPKTFEYLEKGGDEYYGKRSWPFARLVTKVGLTLEGHIILPGNYAFVLNPARKEQGATLTLLKIADELEFLKPGKVFEEVPTGTAIFTTGVSFETLDSIAADHLKIELTLAENGAQMTVLYGNRKFSRTLGVS